MKENNSHNSLDELLLALEHAGRDARRQQELASHIEQLAASDVAVRRRRRNRWLVRVAAAACMVGVTITTVRLLQPAAAPEVAELTVTRPSTVGQPDSAPAQASPRATAKESPIPAQAAPLRSQSVAPAAQVADEVVAEVSSEMPPAVIPLPQPEQVLYAELDRPEALQPQDSSTAMHDEIAEQIARADIGADKEENAIIESSTDARRTPAPRRRLFRRAQPSMMRGSTLPLLSMNFDLDK